MPNPKTAPKAQAQLATTGTKWAGRSRQVWVVTGAALTAALGALEGGGILPAGFSVQLQNSLQMLVGAITGCLAAWSMLRPDNATLTVLPSKTNSALGAVGLQSGALDS